MSDSNVVGDATDAYVRGGGRTLSISRHAGQILIVTVLLCLAALTIAFAVLAHQRNDRRDRLHDHGKPVTFTVTGCIGTATGTGITVDAFTCHGTYDFQGTRYRSALGESTALHQPRDVIAAVVDPAKPTTVALASAVARERSSSGVYSGTIVCGGAFLLVAIFAFWWARRPGGRGRADDADVDAAVTAATVTPAAADNDPAPPAPAVPASAAEQPAPSVPAPAAKPATPPPPASPKPAAPIAAPAPVPAAGLASSTAGYGRLVVPAAGVLVAAVAGVVVLRRRGR